jgi:hypothetical protein
MEPSIKFTITPTGDGDWSRVTLVTSINDGYDIFHEVVLYDQLRQVKRLSATQSVEWWTLGELAANAYAATGALISLINGGSVTLMAQPAEH